MINNKNILEQLVNSIEKDCYSKIEYEHTKFIEEFEKGANPQVRTQQTIKDEINQMFSNEKYMPELIAKKNKRYIKK